MTLVEALLEFARIGFATCYCRKVLSAPEYARKVRKSDFFLRSPIERLYLIVVSFYTIDCG
jgi:hypothetical protein